ncbi:MAG: hypothetical protein ACFB0B_15435 [Thermonemataceae bacterium]
MTKLQTQVAVFNETYGVGDKIEVWRIVGEETFIDEISHVATILNGHTAVVWLKEKGSYDISFVKSLVEVADDIDCRHTHEIVCPHCGEQERIVGNLVMMENTNVTNVEASLFMKGM